jgi:hypothetical protein
MKASSALAWGALANIVTALAIVVLVALGTIRTDRLWLMTMLCLFGYFLAIFSSALEQRTPKG